MKNFYRTVTVLLILIAWAVTLIVYPHLPASMVSHWSATGQANGYLNRFWGALLLPLIITGVYLLFWLVPVIDPKKENIEKFRPQYDQFVMVFTLFLVLIHGYNLLWNLGYQFSIARFISVIIAGLFWEVGHLLAHAEPSWFIGVRTPWTMSNNEVWYATQAFAAKLFVAAAVVCVIGVLLPSLAPWLIVGAAIVAALSSVVFSYIYYQRVSRV